MSRYSGGIFDGYCPDRINHAVTLVGYASNYFKIRNSWGSGWGERGYIRLGRTSSTAGVCGVTNHATYTYV